MYTFVLNVHAAFCVLDDVLLAQCHHRIIVYILMFTMQLPSWIGEGSHKRQDTWYVECDRSVLWMGSTAESERVQCH